MENFEKILGNNIKKIRKENNLNQEEFCKEIKNKISPSNLSKVELGKIKTSVEVIREIIIRFKISPYELLEIEENENVINDYYKLNYNNKKTIESMIKVLLENEKTNLHTSMNTEENEENKKSS